MSTPPWPYHLCGGCHQWGGNPRLYQGKCQDCDRCEMQIMKHHGVLMLTAKQMKEIRDSWIPNQGGTR